MSARRVVVAAAMAVLALPTVGCGLYREEFEPRGEGATAARQQVPEQLSAALGTAAGDLDRLAEGGVDECGRGQKNWKLETEHAWQCEALVSAVLDAAPTRAAVADALEAADARATDLGCEPVSERSGLRTTLEEYWVPSQADGKDPGDLPEGRYSCPDAMGLVIEPTTPRARPDTDLLLTTKLDPGSDAVVLEDRPFGAAGLVKVSGSDAAMLLVTSVTRTYYAVDW